MEAINITAYPSDISQVRAIKAVLKALKIQFEMNEKVQYNPDFIAKINQSKQDYAEGNFVTIEKEQFKSFLGIE
jgi:hypothetical protein